MPQSDNGDGEQHAGGKPKPAIERLTAQKEFHARHRQERHPSERPFGQESERERDVKREPPIFPMPRVV